VRADLRLVRVRVRARVRVRVRVRVGVRLDLADGVVTQVELGQVGQALAQQREVLETVEQVVVELEAAQRLHRVSVRVRVRVRVRVKVRVISPRISRIPPGP